MNHRGIVALVGTISILTTACANGGPAEKVGAAPSSVTTTAAPTSTSASATAAPASAADTVTPTPEPTQTDAPLQQPETNSLEPTDGATPIVLDERRSGQELGLDDFPFREGEWKGGVFSVDGAQVSGIATFLTGCSDYNAQSLQMRLGKRFKKLTFMVGQGDNSESQKDKILVQVEVNGRPITPKSVPFTTPTSFTVDTTGVNGLEMTFVQDENVQNCGTKGKVQAVVYKAVASK
ncbi:hypothetical protein [Luteococcus sp.]|uniref:hypothetical protein n=1 Tax=Luteococcus sp. TaxID=1969402 RepID=UPI0037353359